MANSEKDRLGDKLHKKEKAEEDRYFAERDKALLEKLRRGTDEHCPTCGAALGAVERQGKTVHECPTCRRPAR